MPLKRPANKSTVKTTNKKVVSKPVKKEEIMEEEVLDDEVEEDVEVDEVEDEETEEVVEDDATEEDDEEVEEKPAPKKVSKKDTKASTTKKTPGKKVSAKNANKVATTKKTTVKKEIAEEKPVSSKKTKFGKEKKPKKEMTVPTNGTVTRDILIDLMQKAMANNTKLAAEGIEKVEVAAIIKDFETIFEEEVLKKNNSFKFGPRSFNVRKIKARFFQAPRAAEGKHCIVLPHYKVTYNFEESDKIYGTYDAEAGVFVDEEGNEYTQKELDEMDAKFFESEE